MEKPIRVESEITFAPEQLALLERVFAVPVPHPRGKDLRDLDREAGWLDVINYIRQRTRGGLSAI